MGMDVSEPSLEKNSTFPGIVLDHVLELKQISVREELRPSSCPETHTPARDVVTHPRVCERNLVTSCLAGSPPRRGSPRGRAPKVHVRPPQDPDKMNDDVFRSPSPTQCYLRLNTKLPGHQGPNTQVSLLTPSTPRLQTPPLSETIQLSRECSWHARAPSTCQGAGRRS